MKTNHTAGPWHADTREHYLCGGDMLEITLHDQEGMVTDQIASVMLDTGDDEEDDQKRYKEQEANAILIAAAPDLLESLLEVLESAVPNRYEHPSMFTAWEKARAAIKKAGVLIQEL